MLSTPATRLERLYLLLSLPTPLLSPITSSQQQVGGVPPQHMHMCVATCKPRINFQRKFTISVKLSFQVFSRQYLDYQFAMARIPLRITSGLPLPAPQSSGFKNIQFSGYFRFFSHSFRQQEDFLFHPPHIQLSQFTLNTSLTVQLQ